VKTLWICGLLSLLSIGAYSRIPIALSRAAEPLSETRASPSMAAPPSPNTPVGVIARDASSGGLRNPTRSTTVTPAPGSTNTDNNVAIHLSEYVFLHETRNASISLQIAARTNVCPE
jgi:hypothetical protein